MMRTRLERDILIMAIVTAAIVLSPIHWIWKGVAVGISFVLIPCWPLLALLPEPWRRPVDQSEVLLAMRANVWQTVSEVRATIAVRREFPRWRISILDTLRHIVALAEDGTIEGREREPQEPAAFGMGSAWEYRRRMG